MLNAATFDDRIRRISQTRLKIEPTCTAVQAPPRAVATPRAFSDRAMPRCDVAPADCISRMIGATFLAKRSASAFTLATEPLPHRNNGLS
jgi:hypothetical protein